jgi:hypothetical protein
MRVHVPAARRDERERVAARPEPADLARPALLPIGGLERDAARRADRQDGRPGLARDRLPHERGVGDEHERPLGGVDLLVGDREPRVAAEHDVQLLVPVRAAVLGRLVVALDGLTARLRRHPGIDAEGADAEVVAERLPVRLGVRVEHDRRDVVEVGGDDPGGHRPARTRRWRSGRRAVCRGRSPSRGRSVRAAFQVAASCWSREDGENMQAVPLPVGWYAVTTDTV